MSVERLSEMPMPSPAGTAIFNSDPPATTRKYTSKQMGDACEMLVAAELTLAGVPALRVPDFWPGYDVIAQPKDPIVQSAKRNPLRISVKSRTFKSGGGTFVTYLETDDFDWLA